MKKKSLVLFTTLFCLAFTFAQQEASYWYFGQNAGLRFNAGNGTVTAITDGQINTLEGCTSISDVLYRWENGMESKPSNHDEW